MNRLLPFLLLLIVACSRAHAERVDSGDDDPPTATNVSRVPAQPPRWPEEYPSHFIRLPPSGDIAIAFGDQPSDDHPDGTVYVFGEGSPRSTMSEWDLASGSRLRRRVLPFDAGDGWPRMLHQRDATHVVASSSGGVYYTMLDTSFRVIARTRLGDLDGTSAALASDGAVTVVLGRVRPSLVAASEGTDAFAAAFDSHGRLIADRELGYGSGALGGSSILGDYAAVARGTPYVLSRDGGTVRLHELAPDLTDVISTVIPVRGTDWDWNRASLSARGDRLVIDTPPRHFECSLDLTELREVPSQAMRGARSLESEALDNAGLGGLVDCEQSAASGPIYALSCFKSVRDAPSVQFIAWDRAKR